ncbi:MAG TPA: hypothetical protein VG870_00890 [Chitinophagaceae bacterium]|nr:hypothetical protein [Chitinophagaceae bacterium]
MEENQNQPLFSLHIDATGRVHLAEAARWARFLSIVGFILCGLIVIMGLFFSTIISSFPGAYGMGPMAAMGGAVAVLYLLIALFYFFMCLFLYRFGSRMKMALATENQDSLNISFQNLKVLYRYVGIITIIILVIYGISLIFLLLGAGMSRL